MYILEKLQRVSEYIGKERVDGELARYFIENINQISTINLQKCIKDTGVSKAAIHRFYSKAGFESFREFITVIAKEFKDAQSFNISTKQYQEQLTQYINKIHFDDQQLTMFTTKLLSAKKIVLYGQQKYIDNLTHMINVLRNKDKSIFSLNSWNMENVYEEIKELKENDVLIIIETTLNVQNMYESSMNKKYMLNLDKINNYACHKFYIGESNCMKFNDYHNIKINKGNEDMMTIGLYLLDNALCQKLEKE